jgi:endoglucanase
MKSKNIIKPLMPGFLMKMLVIITAIIIISSSSGFLAAYQGMAAPKLHVDGRYLQDPGGQNVRLVGGWMQPTATWFNGQGRWYSDPTDWTNPGNVSGMLNFMKDAATLMSDTSPKYGRDHGWYASFVRVNTDTIGGWTNQSGLVDSNQFNGWIQNFVVPYADHLRSCGLYLVLCATGPINMDGNGANNAGTTEQQRLRTFWSTVANAPGVKSADNIHFELMNEPVNIESSPGNGDWGCGQAKYFSAFRDWIQPIINDIRNTGADNIIWVPTLEWQGSPQQHAQYPFSGSNCGIAAHYYPAYGGCYDGVTCHNDLWNRNYKPATDLWPMIITENFWFPEDTGLCAGSTANYGNTLKANMDREGNVSYMIGFLGDLLDDLNNALPADCSLSSKEGAQAAFEWFYDYYAGGGATPAPTTPPSGVSVPAGVWFRLTPRHATDKCLEVAGGETANGSNVQMGSYFGYEWQQWRFEDAGGGYYRITPRYATDKCLDVSGVSQDNGATIHIWDYQGGANQQWLFNDTGDGYYSIAARHSGKCVDVAEASTADGANVHQWDYLGGANQQWSLTEAGDGDLTIGDTNGDGTVDIVDALLVAQYYVGLNPSGFNSQVADVNCTGTIDIVDALMVAQYYVGLITSWPC